MRVFVVLFLVLISGAMAQQTSDAFNVTAYDDHFRVVAPVAWKEGTSMILHNQTTAALYGEIRTVESGRTISSFSVRPHETLSVALKLQKNETAVLIPLSPSFQEVTLQFGKKPYEIPPKR